MFWILLGLWVRVCVSYHTTLQGKFICSFILNKVKELISEYTNTSDIIHSIYVCIYIHIYMLDYLRFLSLSHTNIYMYMYMYKSDLRRPPMNMNLLNCVFALFLFNSELVTWSKCLLTSWGAFVKTITDEHCDWHFNWNNTYL